MNEIVIDLWAVLLALILALWSTAAISVLLDLPTYLLAQSYLAHNRSGRCIYTRCARWRAHVDRQVGRR